jgi:hypothetical protein
MSSGSLFQSVWRECLSRHKIGARFAPKHTTSLEIILDGPDGTPR